VGILYFIAPHVHGRLKRFLTNVEEQSVPRTTETTARLNLDLSSSAYKLLQQLSEETDKNMADVLRTGLAVYGMAHEASKRGQSMGIIEGDKVIKEIIII
jgi:hypothetical protein